MRKLLAWVLGQDRAYERGVLAGRAQAHLGAEEAKREAVRVNYPVGGTFIIRSNEPGPLIVSKVVGYHELCGTLEPLFVDSSGHQFIHGGVVSAYHLDRLRALEKLSWHEQWNAMSRNGYIISDEFARIREAAKSVHSEVN